MHGLGTDTEKIKNRIRFCDYLSVAQLYLQDNFLLKKPLTAKDIKPRLLGHWGTCHGINVAYANLKAWDQNIQFILGPGHGYPALQANLFYDDELKAYYPEATKTQSGLEYICKQFSWPYGFPSHTSPATPGAILEGGELGYSLAAAYGASLGKPDQAIAVLIGDGELETATALASLNLHKLLNHKQNARIIPILHLNGYKISGPTIYGRSSERELLSLLRGFDFDPIIINGEDTETFQITLQESTLDTFIIMKTQKGATGPQEWNGEKIAGNYLSHQIPLPKAKTDPQQLKQLQTWLKSYNFNMGTGPNSDNHVVIAQTLLDSKPKNDAITITSTAKTGPVPHPAPHYADLPETIENPGQETRSPARTLGQCVRDTLAQNTNFYFFSPDETTSNKLDAVYEATGRAWNQPQEPWDKYEQPTGRVIELLSENTLLATLAGHILSGGQGAMASYEAFLPIISSQLDQHLKFLAQSKTIKWRPKYSSLNLLSTSAWQRQDHNGYTHQNPALISTLLAKPSNLANCLFPVDDVAAAAAWEFMTHTKNVVNLTTFNKTDQPRWIDINHARFQLKSGGASIFRFASDEDQDPDLIFAAAGDIPTTELLAAKDIVKQELPSIKIRFIGIAALSYAAIGTTQNKLKPQDFTDYFTSDKPIIANFHGYPETLRSILTHYTSPQRLTIHGYQDQGSTTTPLNMLTRNHASRFDLAISAFNLQGRTDLAQKYQTKIEENTAHARQFGIDKY